MRFRLLLESDGEIALPINYQYALSAVVYRFISTASGDHARWLHETGHSAGAKTFKHFTYSKLLALERPRIDADRIFFPKQLTWYLSFAIPDTMQHFIVGLFENQLFWLVQAENVFHVKTVEALPDPEFEPHMRFTCLSPIFVKKPYEKDGRLHADHLLPDHPEFSQLVKRNLLEKLVSLKEDPTSEMASTDFEFIPDRTYIEKRGGMQKISKLITIKEGEPDETRNRAFECPFALRAHPELIRTAYASGMGNDNAMGFGMIETVDSKQ